MQLNAWEYPVPPIEYTEELRARKPRLRIGPGVLVTAAFIGPGTVITASRAGAEHGHGLLWTVVLAVIGAIVLQSLAAKIGIEQRQGLGESIRAALTGSVWLSPAICLVIFAIGVGNAAYQTGNLNRSCLRSELPVWWSSRLLAAVHRDWCRFVNFIG